MLSWPAITQGPQKVRLPTCIDELLPSHGHRLTFPGTRKKSSGSVTLAPRKALGLLSPLLLPSAANHHHIHSHDVIHHVARPS